MEEMHKLLYLRQFSILKLTILLAFALSGMSLTAQKVGVMEVHFPIFPHYKLSLRTFPGIQSLSIDKTIMLDTNGFARFSVETSLEAAYFEVFLLETDWYFDVYIPAGDTVKVGLDKQNKTVVFPKDPANRNQRIVQLNAFIDDELNRFYSSKRTKADKSRLILLADSARFATKESNDSYLRVWSQLVLADMDEASGLISQQKLLVSLIPYMIPSPGNPAWTKAFSHFFDADLLNRMASKQGLLYRSAIISNDYYALKQLYQEDSLIKGNTELVNWLLLKGIYDLQNIRDSKVEQSYRLLLKMKGDSSLSPMIQQEVNRIIATIQPKIKGEPFPDLGCNEQPYWKQQKWNGLPVYLAILPNYAPSSQLVIRQFAALQTKYGKEMHFALLIPEVDVNEMKMLNKQFPELDLGQMDLCREKVQEKIPSTSRTNFILIDHLGNVYQNPAEGPETDVESAFLGLIKLR